MNKIAMITGAGSGVGRATAKALAALKAGLTEYELTITVEEKSHRHYVTIRREDSEAQ